VFEYEVPVGVAIWAYVVHVAPEQLSTRYPVTPTASVDAFHERFICDEEITDAEKPDGTEGAVVSGAVLMVSVPILNPERIVAGVASLP
jgi:hypothetical protein